MKQPLAISQQPLGKRKTKRRAGWAGLFAYGLVAIPMLFDTHAHLDDERFAADLPAVLERMRAAGVAHALAVATTAPSAQACLALATAHEPLYASVGIHPNHAQTDVKEGDWDRIVALARTPKAVALGETGLDRHWDFTPFPVQVDYFARHLELSRQTGKPLVIHCREAEADLVPMLKVDFEKHGPLVGILHSFAGDQALADAGLAMGLHLSFSGILTAKGNAGLRAAAAQAPLDRLLVETDCPYLVPVPLKGKEKRNEPSFVVHTARCLAETRGMPFEALAAATTANARRLFGLA